MNRTPHLLQPLSVLTCVFCTAVALLFASPSANAQTSLQAVAVEEAKVLRFRDFYQSPIGAAGLQMSSQLLEAHGQRVRLTGYMVAQETALRGHFFLTPLPVSMSSHADGEADDLPPATVLVQLPVLDSNVPVLATRGLLQLTGRLQVGRFEMPDGRVVWVRLLLEPLAPRSGG